MRIISEKAFELAVIDFAMPRMNGAELAKAARQQAKKLAVILWRLCRFGN